jgi:uncharacterized lipoprotein YddW (UPF0748 family)
MKTKTINHRSLFLALPLLFCLGTLSGLAQSNYASPALQSKREFRAVWIATVANIDYPSRPATWRIPLREEYRNMLDRFKRSGFNAAIVQVRPACDALYPSELVPWSKYLTGKQGQAPDRDFDPLAFMVEEAHQRGMEFHAWLNPYRATLDLDTLSLSPDHVFYRHRDWLIRYGNRFYLNPALPQVRQHLQEVVAEIVSKYDIDAIHFDDYFYPYKIKDEAFPDSLDFLRFGGAYRNIEDWRRNNVDMLIEQLSTLIKEIKPHVRFGISPFGVWRNKNMDPMGSDTRAGQTNYDDLYADVLKWMRNGWIDYVAPQIYWHIGFEPADYATLLRWWSTNAFRPHVYIGHGAYKVGANPELPWHDAGEIPRQIAMNRSNRKVHGSIYFSAKSIVRNPLGLKDSLEQIYRLPALLPEMDFLDLRAPAYPDLRSARAGKDAVRLKWRPNPADRDNPPAYYVVYRFPGTKTGDFENPEYIAGITPFMAKGKKFCFDDKRAAEGQIYTYAVTAVNRQHTESEPSPVIRTGRNPTLLARSE